MGLIQTACAETWTLVVDSISAAIIIIIIIIIIISIWFIFEYPQFSINFQNPDYD